MINIAIIEDDLKVSERVAKQLSQWPDLCRCIGCFTSATAFRDDTNLASQTDLLLLDIEVEGSLNGIEFLEDRRNNRPYDVVLISSHPDKYGIQGYGLDVFAFLPKPFKDEELKSIIRKVETHRKVENKPSSHIVFHHGRGQTLIDSNEIVFIMSHQSNLYFFTIDELNKFPATKGLGINAPLDSNELFKLEKSNEINLNYKKRGSIESLLKELNNPKFFQFGKGQVINKDFVHRKESYELIVACSNGLGGKRFISFSGDTKKLTFWDRFSQLFGNHS